MSVEPLRGGQARYDEIMSAALDVLRESGYDRLTVDAVVARARASKATVYRRWPSKSALVVAAFAHAVSDLPTHPETGSLRGDLIVIFDGLVLELHRLGDVISGLLAEVRRNADLATAMREGFIDSRKQVVVDIFGRAKERGELSTDVDIGMLWQIAPAVIFFRTLLGEHVDEAYVRRIIDDLILPLCPPPGAGASTG